MEKLKCHWRCDIKGFLWSFHKSERLDTIHLFLLEQQTNLNWFYLSYLQSWTDPRWAFCNQPEKETTHNPHWMGLLWNSTKLGFLGNGRIWGNPRPHCNSQKLGVIMNVISHNHLPSKKEVMLRLKVISGLSPRHWCMQCWLFSWHGNQKIARFSFHSHRT